MDILKKLHTPDYLSIIGLLFSWVSLVFIIGNEPNLGIMVMLGAFLFDLLDGFYARKFHLDTVQGRQLDSFVDIFIYLLFSSLFFYKYLTPNKLLGVLVGFIIIAFGILRLVRFNNEGILTTNGKSYYRGITVVHISLAVLISYFLSRLTRFWNPWISTLLLLIISPLMLSNIKSFKIKSWLFFGLIILIFLLASFFLHYANIK